MEPVFLVILVRAKVMACCFNASVAAGFDLDVRGVAYLVCQRRFRIEENSRDMVSCLRRENVPGRTHFQTDSCVSGCSAFTSHASWVLVICGLACGALP